MITTHLCNLLGIKYPIIQAGMVWVSGAKLAAASSNAGCLGVIGAGSMKPDLLEKHIKKALTLTDKPIAVNIPIMYKDSQEQIDTALRCGITIFITSAGSPKKFTKYLKDNHCIVIHVTSTPQLAKKCEDAGVDAVIVEGFEAGGHNGRDELTSLVLIPQAVKAVTIPVIAAGGFATGQSVLAGLALGAQAIQMGTRFMMTKESSAHDKYKELLTKTRPDSTMLSMKKYMPVRLIKNQFFEEVSELENKCATKDELIEHLGKGRAKAGMLDGDLTNGELEAGQICSSIPNILSVEDLVQSLIKEYSDSLQTL
jgi:enoyl-[acyl-carrier protein] reductase II